MRCKDEFSKELGAEATVYTEKSVNGKSTANSEWTNRMKINMLQIEKIGENKRRRTMKRIEDQWNRYPNMSTTA